MAEILPSIDTIGPLEDTWQRRLREAAREARQRDQEAIARAETPEARRPHLVERERIDTSEERAR
jgi:hypothetical protein